MRLAQTSALQSPSLSSSQAWLQPASDHDGDSSRDSPVPLNPTEREDLPYKVELWDTACKSVEQVLAVTANGSIGLRPTMQPVGSFQIVTSHCGTKTASFRAGMVHDTEGNGPFQRAEAEMFSPARARKEALAAGEATMPNDKLLYCIELWGSIEGGHIEKVLARAANAKLARAIYRAAQNEYPDRRLTLRRGTKTLAETPD
jgi:hypothetical protein